MKFESPTTELQKAVAVAARFVEKRANLPALSAVLIASEGGRLMLRATNLECGVEIVLPVKVSGEGVAAVPGSVLLGFLSNARGKNTSASLLGEVLKVESDRAQASIKTMPHEDFPTLPRVAADRSFTVKAVDLMKAIRSVAYCASVSTIKPELQSVLLYGDAGKLTAVATDSFRLAEKTIVLKAGGSVPQLLVPARNAAEFMRLLEVVSGDIEVYYNDNQLSAQIGDTYFTSRLIDGAFPNYRQIVPKSFSTEAVMLREDFSTSLKSLSVFADKFSQVSFAINPAKKEVTLSSRNPDVGEQVSTIKSTIKGDELAMNFNGRYLADSLQAVNGASVRIQSNGPGKAILIKDAADETFFYLAMPMNR